MSIKRRNYGIPSGVVFPFAGTTAPFGYLVCDGSAVSRAEYKELFQAIGTSHGSGDGSTTFNIPDYRGRFLRGVDGTAGLDPDKASRTAMNVGGNTGNNVGSIQSDAFQGHNHEFKNQWAAGATGYNHNRGDWQGYGGTYSGGRNDVRNPISDGTNGTPRTTSETRPKNANVNYIIKI